MASTQIRVAIIGSGPSGFYAADHLLKQTDPQIIVDMYERLPTPFWPGARRCGARSRQDQVGNKTV